MKSCIERREDLYRQSNNGSVGNGSSAFSVFICAGYFKPLNILQASAGTSVEILSGDLRLFKGSWCSGDIAKTSRTRGRSLLFYVRGKYKTELAYFGVFSLQIHAYLRTPSRTPRLGRYNIPCILNTCKFIDTSPLFLVYPQYFTMF